MGPRRRRLVVALFVAYLAVLVWLILWKLQVPFVGAAAPFARPVKLAPFVASGDAGPSAPGEVAANVAFFIPFGVYLSLLAPRTRWWAVGALALGTSLTLEIAQHVLAVGTFDVSDLISNTAGGLLGFAGLAAAHRRSGAAAERRAAIAVVVGGAVSAAAIAAFLASGLRYRDRPDVIVGRHAGVDPSWLVAPGAAVAVVVLVSVAVLVVRGGDGPGRVDRAH